ncbi:MAG: polysaccharide biosynthesis C-terminal domain-containing protein [Chitinophagaceae bacterium]
MSQIRRQSIISTFFVYLGFAIGFINTYLFTRKDSPFLPSEYGLTQIFIAVGNLMFAFANMGMTAVMYKFYPYYNDNLPKKKNDLLTWALLISVIGFIFVLIAGFVFKDLVVKKFIANSPEFVHYYFWIFPFGFSILLFSLLEVYSWNLKKSILTTFFREVLFRALTTILIFALSYKMVNSFDSFVRLYAFTYGIVALVLLIYLVSKRQLNISFTISRVTKKFYKKIISFASLIYFGGLVYMIAQFIETLVIMSVIGTAAAGIFALASVISGLVQAPQRGAIAAALPVLSKAWKDKDHAKINLIYQRSGINLLIASLGVFLIIWLCYEDAVNVFHLKPAYHESKWIFFFIGLAKIVDLGTGVNSQIIGTSIHWRFEFFSGVILLALAIPLNYFFVKEFGIIGAAYAYLISFSVYNAIRIVFLKRKFNMQPFSIKTAYAIILAFAVYTLCHYLFLPLHTFAGICIKSLVFLALYGGGVIYFNLSPDVLPVWKIIQKKSGMKKRRNYD